MRVIRVSIRVIRVIMFSIRVIRVIMVDESCHLASAAVSAVLKALKFEVYVSTMSSSKQR